MYVILRALLRASKDGRAAAPFEASAALRHLRVTATLNAPHINKSIRCGISGMSAGGIG